MTAAAAYLSKDRQPLRSSGPNSIPEIRSYTVLATGLGKVPTPQTFLEKLPLLFRTAFHLRFATHAASPFGGPYPTLGRCPVLEGSNTPTGSIQRWLNNWKRS